MDQHPSQTQPEQSKGPYIALGAIVILAAVSLFVLVKGKSSVSTVQQQSTTSQTETTNATSTPTSDSQKKITLADIAKHATAQDCWMAIDGIVYDVTSFIPGHPGGSAILMGCGKDATELFNTKGGRGDGHGGRAQAMLPSLQIGVLSK